jgi:hypothetical protein
VEESQPVEESASSSSSAQQPPAAKVTTLRKRRGLVAKDILLRQGLKENKGSLALANSFYKQCTPDQVERAKAVAERENSMTINAAEERIPDESLRRKQIQKTEKDLEECLSILDAQGCDFAFYCSVSKSYTQLLIISLI